MLCVKCFSRNSHPYIICLYAGKIAGKMDYKYVVCFKEAAVPNAKYKTWDLMRNIAMKVIHIPRTHPHRHTYTHTRYIKRLFAIRSHDTRSVGGDNQEAAIPFDRERELVYHVRDL